MSRPTIVAQVAALDATVSAQGRRLDGIEESMRDGRRESSEDRRLILAKLDALDDRLGAMEPALRPLPAAVTSLEARTGKLELFRTHVGAMVALAGGAATLLGTGIWYLLTTFWVDLADFLARLLARH
ncbi:hypothetical protein [Xanthobacter autotrophicus]|uniref:hypothetical protein n=1 Tax=Xanthobacter autotrophicus TaxID=280 RepID=UPI00372AA086